MRSTYACSHLLWKEHDEFNLYSPIGSSKNYLLVDLVGF